MITKTVHIITPDVIKRDNLLMFIFVPEEVSVGDYFRFDESIFHLDEAGSEARGLVVPAFAYDSDPREIFEIPEVVTYVSTMFQKCPHLFYHIVANSEPVRPLYLCLIGAVVLSKRNGMAQMGLRDIERAKRVTRELIDATVAYAKSVDDIPGGKMATDVLRSFGVLGG